MINHDSREPTLRNRLRVLVALAATTLTACGGDTLGNTGCTPWFPTDKIAAHDVEELGVLLPPDMRAPENASESPFRAVLRFADTPGPNGLAFVDPGGNVHVTLLLDDASADGQLTVNVGIGTGPLTIAGIGYGPNSGAPAPEPQEVVKTDLAAKYQEGVDEEATRQYADTPKC